MDIQHLIDRLEQALNESRRLPMTAYLLVDEDRIFNVVDQMRVSIPDQVKQAGRVTSERDRILAQAKEEAERIRELARQEAMELVNRDNIVANAHSHAETIIERAQREALQLRRDADEYIMRVLAQLEQDMTRSLSIVRNGIYRLEYENSHEGADPATGSADLQPVNAGDVGSSGEVSE